jgi:hypothetical protein
LIQCVVCVGGMGELGGRLPQCGWRLLRLWQLVIVAG